MARKRKNRKNLKSTDCGVTKGAAKRSSKKALTSAWKGERARQLHGFWKP